MLTRGHSWQGRARANVRGDRRSLRHTRRLLRVYGYVPQAYAVFSPDDFECIDDFGKLRARSWLKPPAQSNDIGEVFRPRMVVGDLRSLVLL